jgi:glutamyl/glutaminyl-tRNA synthetase
LKSNLIPPYSLAHVVDDTLMGTTTVVRGDEWYASLASHLEIFDALGLTPPKYAHTPVASKIDEETQTKRKLSKRKDPEADIRFYSQQGYPKQVVIDYILNLLNSDYEIWRSKNPDASYLDFDFKISKIGSNNPMYDIVNLYDTQFSNWLEQNKNYAMNVFNIDRECAKPRKDIAYFAQLKPYFSYMIDYCTPKNLQDFELENLNMQNMIEVLKSYKNRIVLETKEDWFANIKQIAQDLNYAIDNKLYKQNPQDYKGNVATVCLYLRVAICGRQNSPDLFQIMSILGKEKVVEKINLFLKISKG